LRIIICPKSSSFVISIHGVNVLKLPSHFKVFRVGIFSTCWHSTTCNLAFFCQLINEFAVFVFQIYVSIILPKTMHTIHNIVQKWFFETANLFEPFWNGQGQRIFEKAIYSYTNYPTKYISTERSLGFMVGWGNTFLRFPRRKWWLGNVETFSKQTKLCEYIHIQNLNPVYLVQKPTKHYKYWLSYIYF
jgi:hypothetical protein